MSELSKIAKAMAFEGDYGLSLDKKVAALIDKKNHLEGMIKALEARNAELLAALVEARRLIEDCADEYYSEKHDLAGDLAKIDAVIERNRK